ncbi:YhdP family protein [Thermomonas sp.]|uniref:YhdP family protein n=1 Tax=Thermomonas sp. TaxID=1971895 RepID=UPI00248A58D8|nr:YhdP family protein [Thermomonas sp.]MDI1252084.1 YhdP family protein [Thermomonas sp.]
MLRRSIGYGAALLLVLLALVIGVASQVLPLAERHPEKIAEWLSARAHAPVAFDAVETQWTRRGPLLRLDNLRVGQGKEVLRIGDAEILVAQYTGLLPGRSLTELRVRGLDLILQRDAAGRWQVRGLPGQQDSGGDPFATLERLGELQVSHARLRVLAPELGVDMRLPRIDLRMRVDGPRIRGGAKAWLRLDGTPFSAAVDFDRINGDGDVYAGTSAADLAELADDLHIAGISAVSGRGRVQAWAGLSGHRVVSVHADAALKQVALRGAVANAGEPPPTQVLGALEIDARWAGSIAQWRADASALRIGEGKAVQVLDGISVAGGQRYGLRASRVDAGPLLALAALSDRLPSGLRHWLLASKAGVSLESVTVSGVRGGGLHVDARLRGLHFAAVGTTPGMAGIDASLQGDAHALQLQFDPRAQVVFDWPAGFGVPHPMTLDGDVVAWREGDAWNVQTPGLAIDGKQFSVNARGGMGFPNDGTRPRIDLAVDIGDVQLQVARGFWVHHLMAKSTVDWLNAALQGGTLRDTHAVLAGDLDDWPFNSEDGHAGAGKFRVDARIVDGQLKFHPDWPAAEHVDADIRFEADGFTLDGRGSLDGVKIESLSAGIQRFSRAELRVDAKAAGDAGQFLSMLRASPLHKDHGEVMDNLQVTGPARADFHLLLPFHEEDAAAQQMQGNVILADVSMREKRWKLAFDKVNGQAQYDRGGFIADKLQVLHDGAAGVLSLRSGPHVQDPKQAFEAELQASVDIDHLLDKAGNLAWLKPYVDGRSPWTVALAIPRGEGQSAPTRLQLRSNLVGTAINLPEPVRKPAAEPLLATIDMALPLERGEVNVALGNLLSLRSRSDAKQTGIRIQFGGIAEAPPAQGLVVGGRADRVDALDWIGVFAGGGSGGSLPFRRIDVNANQLRLLGADFADTRLLMVPAPTGTAVQVQGAGIAGSLLVPQQEGALVAGRFDRLYWRKPPKPPATGARVTTVAAGSTALSFDPAKIPPLLFDVTDFRIGDAALGNARFRSMPVASGMHMGEFSARSPKQRISASGSWTGRNDAARTQLKLDVDSDDIGDLLAGFGLAGQVDGGKGKLGAQANWRGGPEAFDPKFMQASISLDVRDGRLLELEPGAGRVLGLLGIAQLPRRLTLDFRDFFEKGFAFDHITGDVRLAQGSARTDNLTIKGPAANIHVYGSADLRTQRFDQTVDVFPKSGGLLTAVGALAGGPVGAAVGAVANAVLSKPLQGLGAKTYRVTGPWASPTVEVTARGATPKPAPAPAKSAPAAPAKPAPAGPVAVDPTG